jgi:hypothetical protein
MHITISPAGEGRYHAHLPSHGNRLVCTSRTPFIASARMLKMEGLADDDTILSMSHEGSNIIALTGRVGVAARLTVEEGPNGPRFVRYRANVPSKAAA